MKKIFMKGNRGITLIAMIITIIVMLVLAGVSMNAIVGDNGILNNAISATTATSIAVLQEYLQELYVENYDNELITSASSKVLGLSKMSEYSGYFYNPSTDSNVGSLSYVVDSDGHALYLIKKSGLPEEIQNQLVGGDAGDGEYTDYLSLNDVYGVTSNLEVYYCSSGLETITGITSADLDTDDITRTITISSSLASIIGTDTTVTAQSLRSIKSLTISDSSTMTSLSELYNLTSLQEITFSNVTLSSLNGLENCSQLNYVYFKNSIIGDYSSLSKVTKLKKLYMLCGPSFIAGQEEVDKMLNSISNAEYSQLTYLGIFGVSTLDVENFNTYQNTSGSYSYITNLSSLANLSTVTKNAIKYLYINNNQITNLDFIKDFSNLIILKAECNSITSITGLASLTQITYLHLNNNNISDLSGMENLSKLYLFYGFNNSELSNISALSKKTNLNTLNISYTTNLITVSYLSTDTNIKYLYLTDNNEMSMDDVKGLEDIINNCTYYSIPQKYILLFSTAKQLDYSNLDLTDTSNEFLALKNNTTCISLNLTGNTFSNDKLNEILSTMTNLKYLKLYGITNLTSIEFVSSVTGLIELDLRGTSVTDLSSLETYGTSLVSLAIDNTSIDLTKIQKTLSRLSGGYLSSKGYYWNAKFGCGITNKTLAAQLSSCTEITHLSFYGCSMGGTLDLSACTKLTYLYSQNYASFVLPCSLTTLVLHQQAMTLDLSNCSALAAITIDRNSWNATNTEKMLKEFASCPSLTSLTIQLNNGSNANWNSLSSLGDSTSLQNLTLNAHANDGVAVSISGLEKLTTLKSLTISGYFIADSIPDLSNSTNLSYVSINSYCSISDLSGLANNINLETLIASGNSITSLKFLEKLENLTYLDLRNNALYDSSGYVDDDGNSIMNLKIIADLNSKKLTDIYLSGNFFTNYDLIKNLTWNYADVL